MCKDPSTVSVDTGAAVEAMLGAKAEEIFGLTYDVPGLKMQIWVPFIFLKL